MNKNSLHKIRVLSKSVATVIQSTNNFTQLRNAAATTIIVAMTSTAAYAQDIEEISVTGSRITRPGLVSQTPVTSIAQEEFDILATTKGYDYDEYVIMELSEQNTRDAMWLKIGGSYKYWQDARADFIKMFTQEHRKVKLVGRVFN